MSPDAPHPPRPPSRAGSASSADVDPLLSRARSSAASPPVTPRSILLAPFSPPEAHRTAPIPLLTSSAHSVAVSFASVPLPGSQILAPPLIQADTPPLCDTPPLTSGDSPAADSPYAMVSPSVLSSSSSMARAHQFMSFATDFGASERSSRAPSVHGQGTSAFLLPPPAVFVPMAVHGPEPGSDSPRRHDPELAPPDLDHDSGPASATSSDLDVADLGEPVISVRDGTKPTLPNNAVSNDVTPGTHAVHWTTSRRREPPPGQPVSDFPTDDDYVIPGTDVRRNRLVEWAMRLWDQRPRANLSMVFQHIDSAWELVVHSRKNAISPVTLRFEKKRLNDKYNEHTMRIGEGPVRFLGLLLVIPVAVKLAFNSHQLVAMYIAASAANRPWPSCLWGQVFVTAVSIVCMLAIVLMALASCYQHHDFRRRVVGMLGLVLYTILALGDLSALGLSFRCSLSGPSADMGDSGNALIVEDPNVSHHWSSSAGISLFMLVAASNLPFYHGIGISLALALASVCLGILIPESLSSRYWLIMMQAADHLIRGGLAMYQRELISRLTFILDIRLQAKQKSSTKKLATAPHPFAITSSIELSRALLNDHAAGDGAPCASPTLSVANLANGAFTRRMDADGRTTSPPPADASVTHPPDPGIEVTAMLRLPVSSATPATSAHVLDVPPMSTRPMAFDSLVPDRSTITSPLATAPRISMEFVDEAEQSDIDHVLLPALQLDAAGTPRPHGSVMSEDDRRSVSGLLPLGTLGRSHSFQDAPLPPPPLRVAPDDTPSPRPNGVRRRLSRHLSRTAIGLDRDLAKSTDVVALRANGGSTSKPAWALGRVAKQKTSSNLLNTSSMVLSSIDLGKMTKLPTQRPVSLKVNEASAPPIIIATDEDGVTPHIIVNHEDVTSSCESDGMFSHTTGGRMSQLDLQDASTFRLASPFSSVSRSVHDFLSTGPMSRNQALDGSPLSVDHPHQAEGAAGPEETIDRDFDALHNSPMPPPPPPPPPPLPLSVLTLPTIMASPSPSPNSTLPSPLAAQTPITSVPATEPLLVQPIASPSGPIPATKRPKPGDRTCCGRPVQELLRRPRHFFMYTFPSRADESNYRINYYRKLRTRFAITNVTSFLVWAVQAMIGTFVTIGSSARDSDQTRLVVDSWWFRYAPGLVVNLVPLWKLRFSPIQGPSLERFALFHVVLSFAVTIVLDAVRRYQTNDFSVLETSFHQINATVLAATTLRLRTRVHLPFLATVVAAFVVEWGILFVLDREESLTPCLSVFFLATAVSATLSLFFESAARRYFLLRKLTMARPGRTCASGPADKTSPARGAHGGAGGRSGDQDSVHSKTSAVLWYARAEKMGQSLGINPHRVVAVAAMTAHSAAQFLNPNHLAASVSPLDRVDLPPRLRDRRVSIFAENPFRTVDSAGSVPLSPVSSNGIAGSGGSQFSGPLVGGSRGDASSHVSRPISNCDAGSAGGSTAGIRTEPLTRPVPPLASPPPASPPASVAPSSGGAKSERSIGAQRSSPQLPSLDVRSHHSGASDDDDEVDDAWLSVSSSFHRDDMPGSGSRRASTERPKPAAGGVG